MDGFNETMELDNLLDAALADDANDPGDLDESDEYEDVTEGDLIAEGADDDEYEDEEYEDEPASGANSPNPGMLQQLQVQNQAMQIILQKQAEMARQQKAVDTLERLVELKEGMTGDEWASFQAQMAAQYALWQKHRADSIENSIRTQQFQSAEASAREQAIAAVADRLKANRTELAALRACQTPMQMKATIEELKAARAERTQAARTTLREQRMTSGVDRSGGRGMGAGRAQVPQFANIDELVDSIF